MYKVPERHSSLFTKFIYHTTYNIFLNLAYAARYVSAVLPRMLNAPVPTPRATSTCPNRLRSVRKVSGVQGAVRSYQSATTRCNDLRSHLLTVM